MHIAAIITTYNRPDALAAVLEGYLAQHDKGFEVIVADDGSSGETLETVRVYRSRAPFKITHVWQEDKGFRAAAIRNRALAATTAHYVIFTDGDCIPTRGFVAQHRSLAEPGWFLSGNRILLCKGFTEAVLEDHLPIYEWTTMQWLRARVKGDINRWLPSVILPDSGLRKRSLNRWHGGKTCNLSVWREDALRLNGFDEAYSGWGLEDSDFVVRLLHSGIKHKSARFAAPVLHLWHPENDRRGLAENRRRLESALRCDRVVATQGVRQYV